MLNRLLFPLLFFALLLAGCTPETAGTAPPAPTTPSTPVQSPEATSPKKTDLVIGMEADAATMLPVTVQQYITDVQLRNIYDSLIDRDMDGNFVPVLATEWKNVDDLTWEFTLKEGIKFHNGEDFNAEAVKFTIDYILKEENKSFYRSRWTNVKEAKVIDNYKVHFITTKPFPALLERVADDLMIMPPKYIAQVGLQEAAKNPVGTGPYKFKKWTRDQSLELVANEEYWRGAPSIKNLTFRYIPEFSARLSSFLSGEIHLVKNLPVDSVETVKGNPNAKVESVGAARINYIVLNNFLDTPLKEKKVRQALNYAVNVDEILKTVLNGHGIRMTGPLPTISREYVSIPGYEYNPEKAIQLLKDAGYSDPSQLTLQLDTPNGRYPMDSHVSQAIASQLQKIGINVSVQVNEFITHANKVTQREMKGAYLLGTGPVFDSQGVIEVLFTKDSPFSGFYHPEVEEQIQKLTVTINPEERQKIFSFLQQKLIEEAAWIPLWQQEDIYAVTKNLQFKPRPDERMLAYEMSWEQ
ncbi:ABC transporter substrate-binding protein [Brevibacillus invocatus]|uniref:ABC transporter substrate-binding protein n=1 Tax=Brevibacillus invocatus TaxID=173959 RepID=UPI00203F35AF|nr:ABC transporter substrate-binding protein [Brevibacillus invocatus]MCM3080631.1 ABC transporter substrate-binding protein [Brevibacillus invocatus]MCM3432524.1 ABC transporter substrate-binding protein [Brevibacillus invocatus]